MIKNGYEDFVMKLSQFDRWGFTPLEEAERFEHPEVAKLLISSMKKREHPETD